MLSAPRPELCRLRLACASIVILLFAVGAILVLPQRTAAEVTGVGSVGFISDSRFEVDYAYTWASTDCIEGILYFNGGYLVSSGQYCGIISGEPFQGYVFAPEMAGNFSFVLYDDTQARSLYSHAWTTPGVTVSFSLTRTTAAIGDTVGVAASLVLSPYGPDAYFTLGDLTVIAGTSISETLAAQLLGPGYWSYYGETPVPQYGTFRATIPVSFNSTGTKSISVSYSDPAVTKSGTLTTSITSAGAPVSDLSQSVSLSQIVAFAGLAIAVVALVFAVVSLRSARGRSRTPIQAMVPSPPMAPYMAPSQPAPQVSPPVHTPPPGPPQPPG